ncbi:hypothetical protein MMC14_008747, partial [Varicellaria rhodocarpa]|nr:hypothetical protein [Varicellaria rhodocarpa]
PQILSLGDSSDRLSQALTKEISNALPTHSVVYLLVPRTAAAPPDKRASTSSTQATA